MHRTGFCKPLIQTLKILTQQSQYILSVMTFWLFADDTSIIICTENFIDFTISANQILARMIEWFSANNFKLGKNKCNEICNNKSTILCTGH